MHRADTLILAISVSAIAFYIAYAFLGLGCLDGVRCPTRALLSLDCPLCGLTRAGACLGRGDWAAAHSHHRFAIPIFIVLALVVAYGAVRLMRVRLTTR